MRFFATAATTNAARDYRRIEVRPLTGALGAEVFCGSLVDLDQATMAEIRQASADHQVVFFRDQDLAVEDFEAFGARWGEFGEDPFVAAMPDHPHVIRVCKEADERSPFVFGGAWHSDWSFQPAPPAYTMLYAVDVPAVGGDTMWANLALAYATLSPGLQEIVRGLTAIHSPKNAYGAAATHNDLAENMEILYGSKAHLSHEHPVVTVHPDTGEPTLFVNPGYVVGLKDFRPEDAQPILDHLYAVATNPTFTCRFRWERGSLAVWDNRCTLHNPISDYLGIRRELWRITIAGQIPVPL